MFSIQIGRLALLEFQIERKDAANLCGNEHKQGGDKGDSIVRVQYGGHLRAVTAYPALISAASSCQRCIATGLPRWSAFNPLSGNNCMS